MNESEKRRMNEPNPPSKSKYRVAAYLRLGSHCQDADMFRTIQEERLSSFISQHDEWKLEAAFSDIGFTEKEERPGLHALINGCDEGRYDIVLAASISSLSRDRRRFLRLAKHITRNGRRLVFLKEGYALDTESIETQLQLLRAIERSVRHA